MLAFSHSSREIAAVMTCVFGQGTVPVHLDHVEKERVASAVARLQRLDPAVVAKVACALLRYDSQLATQMLRAASPEQGDRRACQPNHVQ